MVKLALRLITFLTSLIVPACSASNDPSSKTSPRANTGGSETTGSGGSDESGRDPTGGSSSASGGSVTGGSSSASACERPGILFCEDFESHAEGSFPGTPWTFSTIGDKGTITIDATTPAKSGAKSAKVDSAGNYQTFLTLTGAPVFEVPRDALHVRAFIRLAAPMTGGHNTYFKAGAAGASSSNNETRVGVLLEMLMINQPDGDRGFLSNQNYWTDKLPGVVIPKEEWTCIEGFFDPPNSTVSIAVADVDVPDLHVTDWKQDPLGALHFGFEQYAGPEAILWYDDIAVGTEPIGCD